MHNPSFNPDSHLFESIKKKRNSAQNEMEAEEIGMLLLGLLWDHHMQAGAFLCLTLRMLREYIYSCVLSAQTPL